MLQILSIVTILASPVLAQSDLGYFRPQDLDISSNYFNNRIMENSSSDLTVTYHGCNFCGEEPPPDDIMFIPSPPLHPGFQSSLNEMMNSGRRLPNDQCEFCNLFYNEGEQLTNQDGAQQSINNRVIAILIAFLCISAVLFIYLVSTRRSKIIASLTRTRVFKSNQPINGNNNIDKSSSLNASISNPGVHLSDPCFLQTNRDKNLTSPIISDHKKTSIPSKYWAQPGSIIGRTIRRIPNEYEVPSSRTNSTGTSSAVYGDMNNENAQRFFSPYNLHTYAEVREVLDPNDHFHTSSNSSVMLSDSNYDNAVYSHGNCALGSGGIIAAPNGSVQMSDFNMMRSMQPSSYNQPSTMNHHHHQNQTKMHHSNGQPIYEQPPPQRAQIIITSNNQGVNPSLLNYKERIHNVI